MQNQAVQAYQRVGRQTVAPRDLEANLLSAAAAHFQRIREDWELLASELELAKPEPSDRPRPRLVFVDLAATDFDHKWTAGMTEHQFLAG